MMKILSFLLLAFFTIGVNAAQVTAPFGFKWGQSQKDILNQKVKLNNCSTRQNITTCHTKNPTKTVSFGKQYILFIDNEKGLSKIKMVSKDITSDLLGSKGKALYNKVKDSLTIKYGESKSFDWIARKQYVKRDEFYQCLKYDGCGKLAAFWRAEDNSSAFVELKGLARGKGALFLSYESEQWSKIVGAIKDKQALSDEEAL